MRMIFDSMQRGFDTATAAVRKTTKSAKARMISSWM